MNTGKTLLGLALAVLLLAGGFAAGTFITQTRAATLAPQAGWPKSVTLPQSSPKEQSAVQSSAITSQQAISATAPLQAQPGWGMMGEWSHGQMMNADPPAQGQSGWGMMGWEMEQHGNGHTMHDGMMGGWRHPYNGYATPVDTVIQPTPGASVSFEGDVLPILTARCISCHGGTAGLYLDTYAGVLAGSHSGAVIIPGDAYNSRLAYLIYNGYMPYRGEPLSAAEIQTILNWIAAGAPNN